MSLPFCCVKTQEILLDLVEVTRDEIRDMDASPTAERMYVDELRDFRGFLIERTAIDDLRSLNLLGVQFALCSAR